MNDHIEKPAVKPLRKRVLEYLFMFGFIIINSALIINPWAGRFWRKEAVNYKDVMLIYFIFALIIGSIYIVLSLTLLVKKSKVLENLTISIFIITLIILADRVLLLFYGLPIWQHDPDIFFKQRPNQEKTWGYVIPVLDEWKNKLFTTNQYGYHDDNFTLDKPKDEFRGVMLGDSVVNGNGLTIRETIPSQLENILKERDKKYKTYQVINTGVQGYSTYQYGRTLEDSLKFKPDFAALGFVANDVIEPALFNYNFGGPGFDIFRQTIQSNNRFFGYLLNSTGFGRLIIKKKTNADTWNKKVDENIKSLIYCSSHPPDDPVIKEAWEETFIELENIQKIVKEKNIPYLLMIFPARFQLSSEQNMFIQKTLIEYAQKNNIDYIDFTPYFEEAVLRGISGELRDKCGNISKAEDLDQCVKNLDKEGLFEINLEIENQLDRYYMDFLHYTPLGNEIISEGVFEYLEEKGLIKAE